MVRIERLKMLGVLKIRRQLFALLFALINKNNSTFTHDRRKKCTMKAALSNTKLLIVLSECFISGILFLLFNDQQPTNLSAGEPI